VAHPQQGAPIVDHHNNVFFEKGHRVALVGGLVAFHTSGEGPQGHEILHHATVPELVLDGVGVVWASLLQEILKVIHGWSCLMLATTCGGRGAHHVGVVFLLVVAAIVADHVCGPLTVLLAPLLAALLDILMMMSSDASVLLLGAV
jgi:hypothetical protein